LARATWQGRRSCWAQPWTAPTTSAASRRCPPKFLCSTLARATRRDYGPPQTSRVFAHASRRESSDVRPRQQRQQPLRPRRGNSCRRARPSGNSVRGRRLQASLHQQCPKAAKTCRGQHCCRRDQLMLPSCFMPRCKQWGSRSDRDWKGTGKLMTRPGCAGSTSGAYTRAAACAATGAPVRRRRQRHARGRRPEPQPPVQLLASACCTQPDCSLLELSCSLISRPARAQRCQRQRRALPKAALACQAVVKPQQ
jgi:hypothetical protein